MTIVLSSAGLTEISAPGRRRGERDCHAEVTSLVVRGILARAVGAIALAWPRVTVLALVILFAVYAFIAAGLQAARAFSSAKAGPARPCTTPVREKAAA